MSFIDDWNNQASQAAQAGGSQSWDEYYRRQEQQRILSELKNKNTAPKKGGGNFLTSLIPTGGGIGGALAGAAGGALAGSAIPVLGTAVGGLLGAIAGGAGGSALGKVGQNAVEGEQDLGKGVAQEALLGGVTSTPLGAGFKLLRAGAKATTGLGKRAAGELVQEAGAQTLGRGTLAKRVAQGTDDKLVAANNRLTGAVNAPRTASKLNVAGTDMQRRVANTSKTAGSYTDEVGIVDTLNRNGLKGSATNMYKNLDNTLGDISGRIQTELGTISTTTPRANVITTLKDSVTDILPDDPTYTREIARSLDRLGKSGTGDVTASELFGFKQQLGNRLSPAFKKMDRGAALTSKEEVEMALWRNIDNEITRVAPGVKDLTMDQSRLISARPGLQTASNRTAGIPILGVKSQKLEQGSQALQNALGRKAAGVTNIAGEAAARPLGQSIAGLTGRRVVGNLLTATGEGAPNIDENGLTPEDYAALETNPLFAEGEVPNMLGGQGVAQPSNPFGISLQDVASQMTNALSAGDTKGYATLADLYDRINDYETSSSATSKPLSAEASKTIGNANSGLTSLSQLENTISKDGGVSKATLVPGRSLFGGLGANVLGTGSYDTAARNITDVITRLRTGAALTDQEAAFYNSQIPQAFDDPETIQTKIALFRDLFNSIATQTGSAGTDTQAALSNLQ